MFVLAHQYLNLSPRLDTVVAIITGPAQLWVQVCANSTLKGSATDTNLAVTLSALFTLPDGASFDPNTGEFTWFVQNHDQQAFTMK